MMEKTGSTKPKKKHFDVKSLNDEGVRLFEGRLHRVKGQVARIHKAITEIRAICSAKGLVIPELETAEAEAREFANYGAKIEEYLQKIHASNSEEERSMLFGIMTQISEPIPQANQSFAIINGDEK